MPNGDSSIHDLLAPVALSTFAERWLRGPLHIPGSPAKLERLLGQAPSLDDLIERVERAEPPRTRVVVFGQGARDEARLAREKDLPSSPVGGREARELLAGGATVAVYGADALDPSFARWKALLRTGLGHAGRATCTWWMSSRGRGMFPHFDAFSTVHVQLTGSKRWRLSPAARVVAPRGASVVGRDGTAEIDVTGYDPREEHVDRGAFLDVAMRPGDVLLVPAGVWHETEGAGDAVSVSCAFDFRNAGFDSLVASLLAEHFAADEAWRYLPLAPAGDEAAEARLASFFEARLDEAIAALRALRGRPFELTKALKRLVADNGSLDRPPVPPPIDVEVEPGDTLFVPPDRPLTSALGADEQGAPVLYLYQEGQVMCFDDPALLPFGHRLVEASAFVARDACAWGPEDGYDWQTVRNLLEALAGSGILRVRRAVGEPPADR